MTEINIKDVFNLSKQIGKQYFRDILEKSCKHKIIKIDTNNDGDNKIIEFITKAMGNFLSSTRKS